MLKFAGGSDDIIRWVTAARGLNAAPTGGRSRRRCSTAAGSRQRHLGLPGADARTADLDLAPTQDDGTRRRARATGFALGPVRVPRSADRDPILFEHGLEDLPWESHQR
jgi:hypothetical protein